MTYQELLDERKRLTEESRAILAKAETEEREISDEEDVSFAKIHEQIDTLASTIARHAKQEQADQTLRESAGRVAETQTFEEGRTVTTDEAQEGRQVAEGEYRDAMNAWCRGGISAVPEEQRALLNLQGVEGSTAYGPTISLRAKPPQAVYLGDGRWTTEQRAAQTVTTTGGGHVIEDEAMTAIETAILDFSGMRQAGSNIVRTSTGASLPIPTINDTSNKGRLLAINTSVTNTALVYGQVTLGAFKYSSDSILVPIELMQDSSFDYASHVAERLGERIGRITNEHFSVGSGTGEPNGVKNVAEGAVTTFASATAIAADEFITIQGTLDVGYEAQGAVWMWKKSTQTAARKLKDSNANYLWAPGSGVGGLRPGVQDTFLGMPVVVNDDLRAIGADKRSVFYGSFRRGYYIRDVMPITLIRLNERYMDDGQFGFIAFSRHDGQIVDAGTNPIVAGRHPAS